MRASGRARRAQPTLGVEQKLSAGGDAILCRQPALDAVVVPDERPEFHFARCDVLTVLTVNGEDDRTRASSNHGAFRYREALRDRAAHFDRHERAGQKTPRLVRELEANLSRSGRLIDRRR
jgi:hypothetical protein